MNISHVDQWRIFVTEISFSESVLIFSYGSANLNHPHDRIWLTSVMWQDSCQLIRSNISSLTPRRQRPHFSWLWPWLLQTREQQRSTCSWCSWILADDDIDFLIRNRIWIRLTTHHEVVLLNTDRELRTIESVSSEHSTENLEPSYNLDVHHVRRLNCICRQKVIDQRDIHFIVRTLDLVTSCAITFHGKVMLYHTVRSSSDFFVRGTFWTIFRTGYCAWTSSRKCSRVSFRKSFVLIVW